MMEMIDKEAIAALRQGNIGRLFQRAARAYSDLALIKLRESGHEGLTLFHTALISNLDLEGTRITILAERAGVSKQAMGQLVADLEQRGYIERAPDPSDGRASLVKFTEQGWEFLQDAYRVKQAIEARYAEVLGEDDMNSLWELLKKLLDNT
jgi:DNA-binding MarR family transcriptional regulator